MDASLKLFVVLAFAAELLVIGRLAGGWYRKYPVLLGYLLVTFFTGVIDAAVFFGPVPWRVDSGRAYYVTNSIRHVAAFALVLHLVYSLTGPYEELRSTRLRLTRAGVLLFALSFVASRGRTFGLYMTGASRNLSFVTTLLVLVLWSSLVKWRIRDPQLLLITGGMGINMAGDAAGEALIALSRGTVRAGGLIAVLSHICCMGVWFLALSPPRRGGPVEPANE